MLAQLYFNERATAGKKNKTIPAKGKGEKKQHQTHASFDTTSSKTLYNAEMLESLFQQQTRQHLRMRGGQQQPWLSQRKKTKKKKKTDTVPQRRRRPGVVMVMGMLWQLPALRVLCLCASHNKVPSHGSVCACFCLRSRSAVLLGVPSLFLFCLPSKKHWRRERAPRRRRHLGRRQSVSLSSST